MTAVIVLGVTSLTILSLVLVVLVGELIRSVRAKRRHLHPPARKTALEIAEEGEKRARK